MAQQSRQRPAAGPLRRRSGRSAGGAHANHLEHDPSDLATARQLVSDPERIPIGLLYLNPEARRYDEITANGLDMPVEEKLQALERELDRFAI